jgi:hypothetical protein
MGTQTKLTVVGRASKFAVLFQRSPLTASRHLALASKNPNSSFGFRHPLFVLSPLPFISEDQRRFVFQKNAFPLER